MTRRESSECTFAECGRPTTGRGLCKAHWNQWRKGRELSPLLEWGKNRTHDPICTIEGCERPHAAKSYCSLHYGRLRRSGSTDSRPRPARSPAARKRGFYDPDDWRTWSRTVAPEGYAVRNKRGPNGGTRIREHRLVMEDHLGRPLLPGENVHHINGVRDDNRLENLELWSVSQPSGQRVVDKVAWAREILEMYADYADYADAENPRHVG